MKIVQAVGWYYPESLGGTEVYVAGLSRRLVRRGHSVTVAAPDPGGIDRREYEHEGIPVFRYPIAAAPSRLECQAAAPVRGAEHFHHWLDQVRPDIVHFHTFVTGLGPWEVKAAKAVGAGVVCTTHSSSLGYLCQRGTMMHWGRSLCDGACRPAKCAACELEHRGLPRNVSRMIGSIPTPLSRLTGALPGRIGTVFGMNGLIARNRVVQKQLLEAADRFVVLTQWGMDAVAKNGGPPAKLALNRLGLSQSSVSPKPGPDDRPTKRPVQVGYLGRFDRIKGVHDLARAVAELPRELSIRIEFRGPVNTPSERAVVEQLRKIVGEDSRVSFTAPVSPEDVPAVLADYDVLCCPPVCLEGGPTVAIEAHAVGTPVLGTRIGGLAELVTDSVNGRLVAPGNWRELAGVLEEIAADPAGTIDAWRRALPEARTMDQIAEDYIAMYEEIRKR